MVNDFSVMSIILALAIGLMGVNLFFNYALEDSFIYFPEKEMVSTPKEIGLAYEDIYLQTTDNVKINCWYVNNPESKKVILFFHGNGGNISHLVSLLKYFYELPVDVCLLEYRGYGRSEGKASAGNFYQDAQLVYDYLVDKKNYLPRDIVVWGWSLGSCVAIDLAVNKKVGGVIIQSGLTSVNDMLSKKYPFFLHLLLHLKSDFNNTKRLKKLGVPILFMHSKKDQIIPYEMGEENYDTANQPKYFIDLGNNEHAGFSFDESITKKIREFIRIYRISDLPLNDR